ncbi:MAG: hypothetical protein KAH84_11950 [Thiomargarita sp.]|nr:hypothetical protein [Thiomargarita sp.]
MPDGKQILLVEGTSDKSFFEKICKNLSLDATVKVTPPKDIGGTHNSKGGVLNQIPILLPQLNDGQKTNIAAIVDADYIRHGSGYQKTIEQIAKILNDFDFQLKTDIPNKNGLYFENSDGLPDFGLWVMPDNKQEGMLEDWIKSCIKDDENSLFQHASDTVHNLSHPKFKPHLTTKAEIATWLAWQKTPGHGLYSAINDKLLDEDSIIYQNLCRWLKDIFLK